MRRIALIAILLTGCTNNQLRRSTVGQAMTLTEIQHRQVLQNLASFAGNPYALPKHVSIHDGTAQITDNGSILGQVINRHFLQIGGQRTIVDQWSMQPVTNDVALKLLRVAYRDAFGAGQNLYTQDLANDLAHELKKQTYQVDDLRTTNANTNDILNSGSDQKPSTVTVRVPEKTYTQGPQDVNIRQLPTDNFGYTKPQIDPIRQRFNSIISSNAVDIVLPQEILTPENIAFPRIATVPDEMYKKTTPLVIELRRQVYETNKDVEAIPTGWLGRSTNKRNIPHDACYIAYAKECERLVCLGLSVRAQGFRGVHPDNSQFVRPY